MLDIKCLVLTTYREAAAVFSRGWARPSSRPLCFCARFAARLSLFPDTLAAPQWSARCCAALLTSRLPREAEAWDARGALEPRQLQSDSVRIKKIALCDALPLFDRTFPTTRPLFCLLFVSFSKQSESYVPIHWETR